MQRNALCPQVRIILFAGEPAIFVCFGCAFLARFPGANSAHYSTFTEKRPERRKENNIPNVTAKPYFGRGHVSPRKVPFSGERKVIFIHDLGPSCRHIWRSSEAGDRRGRLTARQRELDRTCNHPVKSQQTQIVDMKQARYPAVLVLVLAFCFASVRAQFVVDEFGSAEDIYSPDEVAPDLRELPHLQCRFPV